MPRISRIDHDFDSLTRIIDDLEWVTATLRRSLKLMERMKIERIRVRYDAETRRALKYLTRFATDANESMRTSMSEKTRGSGPAVPESE